MWLTSCLVAYPGIAADLFFFSSFFFFFKHSPLKFVRKRGSRMSEMPFGGQEERVSRDDLIKDLADERRTRRRRCQQQEEEAEPQGRGADTAHSHPDHTSVLLTATATKLDFFFFRPLGA